MNFQFILAQFFTLIEKHLSDDPWKRKWQIRNKQTYARYNRWYGETLEGDMYKAETIIVDKDTEKKQKSAAARGNTSPSEKSKGKQKVRVL